MNYILFTEKPSWLLWRIGQRPRSEESKTISVSSRSPFGLEVCRIKLVRVRPVGLCGGSSVGLRAPVSEEKAQVLNVNSTLQNRRCRHLGRCVATKSFGLESCAH